MQTSPDRPSEIPFWASLLRPVFAYPFPGRWKVFGALVNNKTASTRWKSAGLTWARSKILGYDMPCDLSTFSGRIAWHFRRWYEIDTQSLILSLMPQGGSFADIGGNVGMATLVAARAAGPSGRIIAFEPNPGVAAIYKASMARNGLHNVTLNNCAIGTEEGQTSFFVPDDNHGEGSLGIDFGDRAGQLISVRVSDGREINALDRLDLVKIDVEGFELAVLKSITPALLRHKPPIICELMDDHLARAGTSSADVLQYMDSCGYAALEVGVVDDGLFKQRASVQRLTPNDGPRSLNILLVPQQNVEQTLAMPLVSVAK